MFNKMSLLLLFTIIFCNSTNSAASTSLNDDDLFKNGCMKKISFPPINKEYVNIQEHVFGLLLKNKGADLTPAAIKYKINPDLNYDNIGKGWWNLLFYINNDEKKFDDILWLLSTPAIYHNNGYNIDVIIKWKSLVESFTPYSISYFISAVFSLDMKRGELYDNFVRAFLEGNDKEMINSINNINHKAKTAVFNELSIRCSDILK